MSIYVKFNIDKDINGSTLHGVDMAGIPRTNSNAGISVENINNENPSVSGGNQSLTTPITYYSRDENSLSLNFLLITKDLKHLQLFMNDETWTFDKSKNYGTDTVLGSQTNPLILSNPSPQPDPVINTNSIYILIDTTNDLENKKLNAVNTLGVSISRINDEDGLSINNNYKTIAQKISITFNDNDFPIFNIQFNIDDSTIFLYPSFDLSKIHDYTIVGDTVLGTVNNPLMLNYGPGPDPGPDPGPGPGPETTEIYILIISDKNLDIMNLNAVNNIGPVLPRINSGNGVKLDNSYKESIHIVQISHYESESSLLTIRFYMDSDTTDITLNPSFDLNVDYPYSTGTAIGSYANPLILISDRDPSPNPNPNPDPVPHSITNGCACCCTNNITKTVNKYNNCNLDDHDYADSHLCGLTTPEDVVIYFQENPNNLDPILIFYKKMEEAKQTGLVQAYIGWQNTTHFGEYICGDLECFWELYNQKGYFYITILLATLYYDWKQQQDYFKSMGIINCCYFDMPPHPLICPECNSINGYVKVDPEFLEILQSGSTTPPVTNIIGNNYVLEDDLLLITTIAVNGESYSNLENFNGIECCINLGYLQLKAMKNDIVTNINLCRNTLLESIAIQNFTKLTFIQLPQARFVKRLTLMGDKLYDVYDSDNPIVLDDVLHATVSTVITSASIDGEDGPFTMLGNNVCHPNIDALTCLES